MYKTSVTKNTSGGILFYKHLLFVLHVPVWKKTNWHNNMFGQIAYKQLMKLMYRWYPCIICPFVGLSTHQSVRLSVSICLEGWHCPVGRRVWLVINLGSHISLSKKLNPHCSILMGSRKGFEHALDEQTLLVSQSN